MEKRHSKEPLLTARYSEEYVGDFYQRVRICNFVRDYLPYTPDNLIFHSQGLCYQRYWKFNNENKKKKLKETLPCPPEEYFEEYLLNQDGIYWLRTRLPRPGLNEVLLEENLRMIELYKPDHFLFRPKILHFGPRSVYAFNEDDDGWKCLFYLPQISKTSDNMDRRSRFGIKENLSKVSNFQMVIPAKYRKKFDMLFYEPLDQLIYFGNPPSKKESNDKNEKSKYKDTEIDDFEEYE